MQPTKGHALNATKLHKMSLEDRRLKMEVSLSCGSNTVAGNTGSTAILMPTYIINIIYNTTVKIITVNYQYSTIIQIMLM